MHGGSVRGYLLCRTCRLYPRHIEEFESVREITLSASCPEVAKMLMKRREPVRFRTYEKHGEEAYEDFDPFLYSILVDAREAMLKILQNRELAIGVRGTLVLGMAHDIQVRVKHGELLHKTLWKLYELELLREDWDMVLMETEHSDENLERMQEREYYRIVK